MVVIEWLRRADPGRVFLRVGDRTWTYREAAAAVEPLVTSIPRLIRPTLAPEAVFQIMAAITGGGATVLGPVGGTSGPGNAALVVFTSGTTGAPKGVRLTMNNLVAAASASAKHLDHGADDDWLLALPLHHVGGLSIVIRQAYTGGTITMLPGFEVESFASAMRDRVTMVSLVPTMLARLVEHGPFPGVKAVLVGGGPIPPGLLERGAAAGLPVLPTYGMTETLGQVATLRPGEPLEHKAHPLPGVELRTDAEGRIAVKGPMVSPGYLGEPDRPDPWLVTNDLGEIDTDGCLRVLGRADIVIITGGENVNPEEVEAILREHPGVDEVVVIGLPDSEWGEIVAAAYTGAVGSKDLRRWAGQRLEGFKVPKLVVRLEGLPRTGIEKPDRKATEELFR